MRFWKPSLLLLAICATLLCAILLCTPAFAQGASQKGVQVGDIDTKGDPCTDFFQFANGKWRAGDPIPPSLVRWGRRWEAGEDAQEQLQGILGDGSPTKDWPPGSRGGLITEHFGSRAD